MNREQFKGKWNEIQGKVKEKWGKITNDELLQIHGEYDKFVGALQKNYGYMKEQAEEEIRKWNEKESSWGKKESHGSHSTKEGHKENHKWKEDKEKKRKAG